MANKSQDTTVLSTLQDLLILQMATAGVSQTQIRNAVGLGMNRVNRIAKLAKTIKKTDEK